MISLASLQGGRKTPFWLTGANFTWFFHAKLKNRADHDSPRMSGQFSPTPDALPLGILNTLDDLCRDSWLNFPALRFCLLMSRYRDQFKEILKMFFFFQLNNIPSQCQPFPTQTKHSLGQGLLFFSESSNCLPDLPWGQPNVLFFFDLFEMLSYLSFSFHSHRTLGPPSCPKPVRCFRSL